MKPIAALALLLATLDWCTAAEEGPKQYIDKAPSGRFSVVQRYVEPKDKENNLDFGAWETVLHFSDKAKPDATLAADPDRYEWPADYFISPDEQWVLRLQKTGSGENCALLYRVNSSGQVWRLEQHLDDLAFNVAASTSRLSRNDYYHIAIVLLSWDLKSGLLHLKITASPEDKANPLIARAVAYDLAKNKMVAE